MKAMNCQSSYVSLKMKSKQEIIKRHKEIVERNKKKKSILDYDHVRIKDENRPEKTTNMAMIAGISNEQKAMKANLPVGGAGVGWPVAAERKLIQA